jgi:stage II sporulation protein D
MLGWKKLPSTDFTLKTEGDTVDFEGKGYGHGVGLCQWSALERAKEGKTYKEILAYFYPGSDLSRYDEGQ